MKPVKMIGVGSAALFAAGLAFSQIKLAPPGPVKIPPPPMFTNSIIIHTNAITGSNSGSNSVPHLEIKRPNEIPSSSPGIYLTKPFSMMMRVPGPMHDDVMMFPQNQPEPPIRIIRPELKTIPLSRTNQLK
jgi:hypothetical protein